MFDKMKKIIIYSTIIAIPCGLALIAFKYFYNKSNGKEPSAEDVAVEIVTLLSKSFAFIKNIKK